MSVKDDFLNMERFHLQDGKKIRFWKDLWIGDIALKVQYPNLFNIVRRKIETVAEVFRLSPLNVSFRRSLVDGNLQSWHNLVMRLTNIQLTNRPDIFKWSLNFSSQFSVNSMYQAFIDTNVVPNNSYLWKIKIPLKIKVFICLLYREAILTKDNLVKRN
jgi:hypothetical protein